MTEREKISLDVGVKVGDIQRDVLGLDFAFSCSESEKGLPFFRPFVSPSSIYLLSEAFRQLEAPASSSTALSFVFTLHDSVNGFFF